MASSSSLGSFRSSFVLPASSMSDTCDPRSAPAVLWCWATTHKAVVGDVQQAVVLARHMRHLRAWRQARCQGHSPRKLARTQAGSSPP